MKTMYVRIETKNYSGLYLVKEIIGRIICVDINGVSTDFNIGVGEVKGFYNEDGSNYIFRF